ncbi:MAG: 2-hydroxychromene-2-carboxylate isomerase [Beijerinckiaceae bacterium]|nr:2-hydroxychromene-2-carboxylate isomerase [Beijerinckiaceae bacterium]
MTSSFSSAENVPATSEITYYVALASPWAYLGHERFWKLARDHDARIRLRPIDLAGQVFPVSGGVPLENRSAARKAYRLVELRRFSQGLNVPMVLEPRYFPVDGELASKIVVAADHCLGATAAMRLTAAIMSAIWRDERDIADPFVMRGLITALGLPGNLLEISQRPAVARAYMANARFANKQGVFGVPSYVLNGEVFWGQDRLDFLAMALSRTNCSGLSRRHPPLESFR